MKSRLARIRMRFSTTIRSMMLKKLIQKWNRSSRAARRMARMLELMQLPIVIESLLRLPKPQIRPSKT